MPSQADLHAGAPCAALSVSGTTFHHCSQGQLQAALLYLQANKISVCLHTSIVCCLWRAYSDYGGC